MCNMYLFIPTCSILNLWHFMSTTQGILSEADGIIISRGNLGLDCEPEKMALVQKTLMQVCSCNCFVGFG